MRVVGYARTSWAEQTEGTHPSIELQERALKSFAASTGLALEKIFTDSGISPTQGTCAGLINILDSMESEWEAVVCTSACRLRGVDAVSFDPVAELTENGKKVLVANQATGAVLTALLERRKEAHTAKAPRKPADPGERRREIAERLLKGREEGAKQGKHQSGPAPFGYRRDYSRRSDDGVLLVPDEEECEVVKLIFREYLRLRSMKRLIKLLDEQGLRTRRGKRWSRAGVSWILKNDTYVGRVHFGSIRVKGKHDSIVPPILFNKVQKLIRANNKRKRTTTKVAKVAVAQEVAASRAVATQVAAPEATTVLSEASPKATTASQRRRRSEVREPAHVS